MPRGFTRSLQRAAARDAGVQAAIAGLKRVTTGGPGGVYRTQLVFTDTLIPVTDALAYAGLKVFDFPLGRVNVRGGRASLLWGVTTARAGTINDSASLTWGVGTAAASNIVLATTMVNIIPITTKVLAAATTAYNTASAQNGAAAATYDGTATAIDAYLNVAFATNTDIDADGTLKVSGTIDLAWECWGL